MLFTAVVSYNYKHISYYLVTTWLSSFYNLFYNLVSMRLWGSRCGTTSFNWPLARLSCSGFGAHILSSTLSHYGYPCHTNLELCPSNFKNLLFLIAPTLSDKLHSELQNTILNQVTPIFFFLFFASCNILCLIQVFFHATQV